MHEEPDRVTFALRKTRKYGLDYLDSCEDLDFLQDEEYLSGGQILEVESILFKECDTRGRLALFSYLEKESVESVWGMYDRTSKQHFHRYKAKLWGMKLLYDVYEDGIQLKISRHGKPYEDLRFEGDTKTP